VSSGDVDGSAGSTTPTRIAALGALVVAIVLVLVLFLGSGNGYTYRLLFETGLPTRYYIPKADVRMDLLSPTDSVTQCPYKGKASYWTARVGDTEAADIAWSYPFPIPECPKIENLVAFYNERADIWVDGELQPKPETPWSRPPR